MILVDTSVWVDHLRDGAPALAAARQRGSVLMHPFGRTARLWTRDKRLAAVTADLKLAYAERA